MTLRDLSLEINAWSKANFKGVEAVYRVLGFAEEWLMEYHQAYLLGSFDEIRDSICDATIFLLDFCACIDVDPQTCIYAAPAEAPLYGDQRLLVNSIAIGRLCQILLKRRQQIRLTENTVDDLTITIGSLFLALMRAGSHHGFDTLLETRNVWKEIVSKRDWNEHRKEAPNG